MALLFLGVLLSVLELNVVDLVIVDGLALVEEADGDEAWFRIWRCIASEDARLHELQGHDRVPEAALELRCKLRIAEDLVELWLDAEKYFRATSGEVPLWREVRDQDFIRGPLLWGTCLG